MTLTEGISGYFFTNHPGMSVFCNVGWRGGTKPNRPADSGTIVGLRASAPTYEEPVFVIILCLSKCHSGQNIILRLSVA
jgi:hypothetical protein